MYHQIPTISPVLINAFKGLLWELSFQEGLFSGKGKSLLEEKINKCISK